MSRPISEIQLIKCPALSPTYRDSYYFNDADVQEAYFNSLSPKTLSESQVTRISNNQVKVPFPVEEIREYNYMRITNQKYDETEGDAPSDRHFYCFIMDAEYVSTMCTLITFKVDVIQTYIVDAGIRESFVERCHSLTDVMFENREAEPFSIENYTADAKMFYQPAFYCFVAITAGTKVAFVDNPADSDYRTTEPHTYTVGADNIENLYSGLEYFGFDLDATSSSGDALAFKRMIDNLVKDGLIDALVDMFIVPKIAYMESAGFLSHRVRDYVVGASNGSEWDVSSIKPLATSGVSGHPVDNKKLYNYPYCYLRVANVTGDYIDLKWEEFDAGNIKLQHYGSWYGGGAISTYPKDYEGISGANQNYRITLDGFPQCPYANDVYKQWKAQKLGSQVAGSAIGFLGGAVSSLGLTAINPVIGALSMARTIGSFISDGGSIVADAIESSKKPNQIMNYKATPENAISSKMFGLYAFRMSLSKHEAEQIDDYFTMFGYAVNKIMDVRTYLNNSARPRFKYIKTRNFNVQGNIPANYKLEFNEIFNNGITFWNTTATVGEYSNNTITP